MPGFVILELEKGEFRNIKRLYAVKFDSELREVGRMTKEFLDGEAQEEFFRNFHDYVKDSYIVARQGINFVVPLINYWFKRVFRKDIHLEKVLDVDRYLKANYTVEISERVCKLSEEFLENFGIIVGEY